MKTRFDWARAMSSGKDEEEIDLAYHNLITGREWIFRYANLDTPERRAYWFNIHPWMEKKWKKQYDFSTKYKSEKEE